ncbi:MAG: heterodisulfide reductase subunit A, partial [Desulfatiglandales bacterium]
MSKKLGVYICKGCGIGDSLDIEKLAGLPEEEYSIDTVKIHEAFCSKEGVVLIRDDIANGLNAVVIAACSPRVNYDVFDFGVDKIVERVNLREQVAWSHAPKDEDTQMLAEDN